MNFIYLAQPPKKYTFEQPALKVWTESWCEGKVLNLFAGKVKLDVDEFRVDVNPEMPADIHIDAYKFLRTTNMEFGTIIFDPPYNLRKSREKYMGKYFGSLRKIKLEIPKVLNVGGRIISFGYDSVGMGVTKGFKKIALCLVCHNGDHNDTICLVEEFNQHTINYK